MEGIQAEAWNKGYNKVLILVLVESGLGDVINVSLQRIEEAVLILVLVESGLGGGSETRFSFQNQGVLILVLVESGLGAQNLNAQKWQQLKS